MKSLIRLIITILSTAYVIIFFFLDLNMSKKYRIKNHLCHEYFFFDRELK